MGVDPASANAHSIEHQGFFICPCRHVGSFIVRSMRASDYDQDYDYYCQMRAAHKVTPQVPLRRIQSVRNFRRSRT